MLAFRRPNEECFCGGTKQEGDFATPFIISNIDQWITSKLQATISINNTLISGSRTLTSSIKKASCVNRHHGADWQCHLPTKDCNGQSETQCPQQTLHSPHPPVTIPTYHLNKPSKHFWIIFGGTNWKQIKANGHWAFLHVGLQNTFPEGNISFPALAGWGAPLLARPTPVGPNGREGLIGTSGLRAALWALQAPLTFQKRIPRSWGELRLINKEFVSLIKLLSKVVGLFLRRNLDFLHQIYLLAFL